MPTKKPGLFEVQGKEPPKAKKPTLRQFLKENKLDDYPAYYCIELLWYPGQWENYSIETTEFRAAITSAHPLFDPLERSATKTFTDAESALLLVLLDSEGTIGLSESNVYGAYDRIGNAGFRFKPTDGAN